MYKTTFQNLLSFFIKFSTNLFSSRNAFGRLFLTFLIFVFSSNGIPDWQKNNGKNFKSWEWEIIKENQDLRPFIPENDPDLSHWSKRAGLQAVSLEGNFYIFGGRTPIKIPGVDIPGLSIINGDVWKSSDLGKTWENILPSNDFLPEFAKHWASRAYFQAVKKDGFMYILGGQDYDLTGKSNFFNDVWRSQDGINWAPMIDNNFDIEPGEESTQWIGRAGLSAVVFKDHIYVMGGSFANDCSINPELCQGGAPPPRIYFNDVWKSSDGSSWEKVNNAPWKPRAGGIAVVKGEYMYMIGGEEGFICLELGLPGVPDPPCPPYFNDVWRTKDGINWEEMTPEAEWDKRPGHQVVVAQDRLVLFGGFGLGDDNGTTPSNPSDVWISNKGKVWKKVNDAPWNANGSKDIKYDFDALVVKGSGKSQDAIYTFGGDRETFNFNDPLNYLNVDNDVWKFSLPKKEVEEDIDKTVLALQPNYPNPFSESTSIKYSIPKRSYVSINVYDRHGRFVSRLVGKTQNEGEYKINWNARNYKNKPVRKGLYYATLWSRGKAKTIKLYKN